MPWAIKYLNITLISHIRMFILQRYDNKKKLPCDFDAKLYTYICVYYYKHLTTDLVSKITLSYLVKIVHIHSLSQWLENGRETEIERESNATQEINMPCARH